MSSQAARLWSRIDDDALTSTREQVAAAAVDPGAAGNDNVGGISRVVNIVHQAKAIRLRARWVKRGLSRDRLVEIAHEYVAANGLDALTMRRLAAQRRR
jgi:hypothetical protein